MVALSVRKFPFLEVSPQFAMSSVRKFPFLGCSRKRRCALFGAVVAALLIVSSGFAGELGALCSAAKDFVSAAKAQEGIVITYPTAGELAASTVAYAVGKKRYFEIGRASC